MPAFDALILCTDRLVLRPLRQADAAALFAIFSDPKVMRFWSTPPWTDLSIALALIERDQAELPVGEHLRLGIERVEDGLLIGTCSLFKFDWPNRRAEVGYALGSAAWGRGYMHEALLALLDYAFTGLSLNRVEADVDPRNAASMQCLTRLGFQQEGLLHERWIVDGEVSDSALFGLLRAAWPHWNLPQR
jgi:[ribosomal protein S5]-alanine N-acetyltransferase